MDTIETYPIAVLYFTVVCGGFNCMYTYVEL
jgi:hypothetical protein